MRERSIETSQSILGKDGYYFIYQIACDSIDYWIQNELNYWKYCGETINCQLDSVFCVNKTGDKIFFSILKRDIRKDAVIDAISYFYGVKIRNTWYFFSGPDLILPREFYQENIHTPLSFDKLKQIATSNIYRGYLKKGKKGQWEINENFFSDIISKNKRIGGYGSCLDCKTEEEYVLYRVNEKWEGKSIKSKINEK